MIPVILGIDHPVTVKTLEIFDLVKDMSEPDMVNALMNLMFWACRESNVSSEELRNCMDRWLAGQPND